MKDHLDMVVRLGPSFASAMISKLLTEANSTTNSGQSYKLQPALQEQLIARAALWKEAILLHEYLTSLGADFSRVPYGLKELPKD